MESVLDCTSSGTPSTLNTATHKAPSGKPLCIKKTCVPPASFVPMGKGKSNFYHKKRFSLNWSKNFRFSQEKLTDVQSKGYILRGKTTIVSLHHSLTSPKGMTTWEWYTMAPVWFSMSLSGYCGLAYPQLTLVWELLILAPTWEMEILVKCFLILCWV